MCAVKDVERADHVAASLVASCYSALGVHAAVIRADGDEVRLIAPATDYPVLAMMLYRAADQVAAMCPAPSDR